MFAELRDLVCFLAQGLDYLGGVADAAVRPVDDLLGIFRGFTPLVTLARDLRGIGGDVFHVFADALNRPCRLRQVLLGGVGLEG